MSQSVIESQVSALPVRIPQTGHSTGRFAQSWRVAEPGCGPTSFCFQDSDSFQQSPGFPKHRFKIHYTILGPQKQAWKVYGRTVQAFLSLTYPLQSPSTIVAPRVSIFHQRWGEWMNKIERICLHIHFHHVTLILKICSRVAQCLQAVIQGPPLTVPVLLPPIPSMSPPPIQYVPASVHLLSYTSLSAPWLWTSYLISLNSISPLKNAFLINLCLIGG